MILFKCKMCGGDIQVIEGEATGTCDSCGCVSTLPRVDDDQRRNLHNRANHLRLQNDFDKALDIYEKMIQEDDSDAEAHWGAVLCKYGIEYVEEPGSRNRIPTCHRASYDNILQDVDYLAAVERTMDAVAKSIYQKQAKEIAELQKNILNVVQNEKPYDVFICYKETDAVGNRTVDSTIAQDIYYQLENEGLKVFFARITLEGKLGQAYEPYIFSALNSAKVMVVVGTKAEYYNATWVKNEWSRYLGIIKKDNKKLLIPCYRDMDAYDIPVELSMLQSQDMSKIGFIQDLIRGIKKVMEVEAPQAVTNIIQAEAPVATGNLDSLFKRAQIFLSNKEWGQARTYYNKVLDINPEFGDAYLGLVLTEYHLQKIEDIKMLHLDKESDNFMKESISLIYNKNIKSYFLYGDDKTVEIVRKNIEYTVERNKYAYLVELTQKKAKAANYEEYMAVSLEFDKLGDFQDAKVLGDKCRELAQKTIYDEAISIKEAKKSDKSLALAKILFKKIPEYKDAKEQVAECDNIINEILYENAMNVKNSTEKTYINYIKASALFEKALGYKDAKEQVNECIELAKECRYQEAMQLKESSENRPDNYIKAIELFEKLLDYKDAKEQIQYCSNGINNIVEESYIKAVECFENTDYMSALGSFYSNIEYKDSKEFVKKIFIEKNKKRLTDVSPYYALLTYDSGVRRYNTIPRLEIRQLEFLKWTDIVSIYSTDKYFCGITSEGKVLTDSGYHKKRLEQWENIVSLVTINNIVIGLKLDGTIIFSGVDAEKHNQACQSIFKDVVSISGDNEVLFGIRVDGTVCIYDIGFNSIPPSEINKWTNIVSLAIGRCFILALRADGTVLNIAKNNEVLQIATEEWTDIISIYTIGESVAAIKKDGSVLQTENTCVVQKIKYDSMDYIEGRNGIKKDGRLILGGYSDATFPAYWDIVKLSEEATYNKATSIMNGDVKTSTKYKLANRIFNTIKTYKDAEMQIKKCEVLIKKALTKEYGIKIFFAVIIILFIMLLRQG